MQYITEGNDGFMFDVGSLYHWLEGLADLRHRRGKRYPLPIALTMIILAKLAGEDEPRGIAGWLRHRRELICRYLNFGRQTTPHDRTIERIMAQAVEVETLDQMVGDYLLSIQTPEPEKEDTSTQSKRRWVVINLDGKTLRGTIPRGENQGLHILAAYLPDNGIVLMQLEVGTKDNEIKIAPLLGEKIDITGKVVTGDALHTQRGMAGQIVEAGGDYLLIAKGNQPNTETAIAQLFTEPEMRPGFHAPPNDFQHHTTTNKGHGRLETRQITTSSMLNDYLDWPYLAQVFQIKRTTVELKTGKRREETVYGFTSLTATEATPADLLTINRRHWGIENGLHYRRDVTFKEDASKVDSWPAQHVMSSLNNLVLGLILRYQMDPTVPDERRRYCAQPEVALRLLTRVV